MQEKQNKINELIDRINKTELFTSAGMEIECSWDLGNLKFESKEHWLEMELYITNHSNRLIIPKFNKVDQTLWEWSLHELFISGMILVPIKLDNVLTEYGTPIPLSDIKGFNRSNSHRNHLTITYLIDSDNNMSLNGMITGTWHFPVDDDDLFNQSLSKLQALLESFEEIKITREMLPKKNVSEPNSTFSYKNQKAETIENIVEHFNKLILDKDLYNEVKITNIQEEHQFTNIDYSYSDN